MQTEPVVLAVETSDGAKKMTYKHSGALGIVFLAVVGAPLTHALGLPAIAVFFATVPGAVAAVAVLNLHGRTSDRHRGDVERQRNVDRRLRTLQRSSEQHKEQMNNALKNYRKSSERYWESSERYWESSERYWESSERYWESSERWYSTADARLDTLQKLVKQPPPARADAVTQQDFLGAVKVLQAGYEGRLDLALSILENSKRAIQAHTDVADGGPHPSAPDVGHTE